MAVNLPTPGGDAGVWDDKLNAAITGIDNDLQATKAKKGQPNGYAGLGADGKVPAGQLPAASGGGGGSVDDDLSGAWYSGRQWYACGTSLTQQGFYTAPLASLSGMVLHNQGASGGSLCTTGGTANGNVWNGMMGITADAEVITLETTNDWRLSATLGTPTDPETNGHTISFYGALKEACDWVFIHRPAARFFLITNYSDALESSSFGNFKKPNADGNWIWEYNDAVRFVAKVYGVPVIDMAESSGINYYTASYFLGDGLHLNTLGGTRFAEHAWSQMRHMSWLTSRPTAPGGIVNIAVTGVSIDQGHALALAPGDTRQMSATVAPGNASNKGMTWSTSDATVATVSGAGLVTAVKAGSANITVTTTDGGKTDVCALTISTAAVTGVTVAPSTVTMLPSTTQQLTATVIPSNAGNKAVTWSSSAPSKATVNSSGLVTSVAVGNATITATTVDGGFTSTCAITVSSTIPVTGVTVAPTSIGVQIGATVQLTATVAPGNASNKSVNWGSSDQAKATVDASGLVTGVTAGPSTITATTVDAGKTGSSVVTVNPVEWVLSPQTTFREKGLDTVSATGSDPTYGGVNIGTFGALIINSVGDNAIEFTVADGTKGMFLVLGSGATEGNFVCLGDTAVLFATFKSLADFAAGGFTSAGTATPTAQAANFATGTIYRLGRSGTRVKIARLDGTVSTPIWDGNLAVNFPTQSAHYTNVDLGLLVIGSPGGELHDAEQLQDGHLDAVTATWERGGA